MTNLANLTASALMSSNAPSVQAGTPLRDAIKTAADGNFEGMPVVDDSGKAVGMIAADGFIRGLRIGADTVGAVMSKQVVGVAEDTPGPAVMKAIIDRGLRWVLVLRDDKPVGLVSWRDIAGKL